MQRLEVSGAVRPIYGSLGVKRLMTINVQQDATIHNFILYLNCSTCFGWFLHPSSGAQINVIYSIWYREPLLLPVAIVEGSDR